MGGGSLAARTDTLVVVDNCEQVIEASASLTAALLERCPKLRVIATSRQPLDVAGELVFPVPPLDLQSEAVELFVDRVRLVLPAFDLTDHNRAEVEAVCRGLDGFPLAIELAASQVRYFEPSQIAARLADRFDLLERRHGGTSRHRSLLATVEWSHDLLTVDAQVLFRRLGVFNGSFDLLAAEAVCVGDGIARDQVVPLLRELIDKSVLVREAATSTAARYRLLETLRLYALDRLDRAGERATIERAHAGHYVHLTESAMADRATSDRLGSRSASTRKPTTCGPRSTSAVTATTRLPSVWASQCGPTGKRGTAHTAPPRLTSQPFPRSASRHSCGRGP